LSESNEPIQLVEHFFRHESANLVAVLTRAFGFGRIDLVEDKVQEAMMTALGSWSRRGVPTNPAGWIHRVARNRILDVLRREKIHQRALALSGHTEEATVALVDEWLTDDQLPDSLLRMIFVCCHPALDRRSQLAMTLKILCGFGVGEVARGLLVSTEAAKKRIQRAKKTLSELEVQIDLPPQQELQERLASVLEVLYLLFNEGYSRSHGVEPLSDDICEEATRLCHLLCESEGFSTPPTRALLALMLFQAARLESRVDADGRAVLLEDQDRSQWDRKLIHIGRAWLQRSKTAEHTRYHLEAGIALIHCEAPSVTETDWSSIVSLYDRLIALSPSPVYILNRAIARAESGDTEGAERELGSIRDERAMRNYYLLDCALARLHEIAGRLDEAAEAYAEALERPLAPHERDLIRRKLARLSR